MLIRIFKGKHLPKELWGEAVSTTTYFLNRCPTKKPINITPEESSSGIKEIMIQLGVVSSVAYRHVPDHLRRKLDDKRDQMICVGYHSTSGYKPYDDVNKRPVISMDLIFL